MLGLQSFATIFILCPFWASYGSMFVLVESDNTILFKGTGKTRLSFNIFVAGVFLGKYEMNESIAL